MKDKSADFKHTWQKLLDYGTMNDFQEEHYLQALGSILRGEAYEIFTEYKQFHRTLKETLDYFSGVYTKKRSLADDRKAVDEFTRRKGESIVVCMERAILAIDRLRLVHPTDGWEALRQQMRHNILIRFRSASKWSHVGVFGSYKRQLMTISMQSTKNRVQSTEYSAESVQHTEYSAQSPVTKYSVRSTANRVQRTKYSVQRTEYNVQSRAYRVQHS